MPNGKQEKQHSFQDWGWDLPDAATDSLLSPTPQDKLEQPQYSYQNWGWDIPGQPDSIADIDAKNKYGNGVLIAAEKWVGLRENLWKDLNKGLDNTIKTLELFEKTFNDGGESSEFILLKIDSIFSFVISE